MSPFDRTRPPTAANTAPSRPMQRYRVALFHLDSTGTPAGIEYSDEGDGAPPDVIFIDGFSEDHAIDMRGFWSEIREAGLTRFEAPVTIRETIVKFGDTQQLVDHYLLRIEVTYA